MASTLRNLDITNHHTQHSTSYILTSHAFVMKKISIAQVVLVLSVLLYLFNEQILRVLIGYPFF